jgi:hypothetical protein
VSAYTAAALALCPGAWVGTAAAFAVGGRGGVVFGLVALGLAVAAVVLAVLGVRSVP